MNYSCASLYNEDYFVNALTPAVTTMLKERYPNGIPDQITTGERAAIQASARELFSSAPHPPNHASIPLEPSDEPFSAAHLNYVEKIGARSTLLKCAMIAMTPIESLLYELSGFRLVASIACHIAHNLIR